jgi:hypothetical protein
MNKKGSFGDILYLGVFLFILAIVIGIGWVIYSRFNAEWQTHSELGAESLEIMQNAKDRYVATYDNLFLVILVGMYLGALLLAWNIDTSPVFFLLSLVMMGVIVIVTAVLGNSWYTYSTNAALSSYIDDFTIIPFVMTHLVEMFVVMGFGLAAVMYSRTQG